METMLESYCPKPVHRKKYFVSNKNAFSAIALLVAL